jgi:hypothetical protein
MNLKTWFVISRHWLSCLRHGISPGEVEEKGPRLYRERFAAQFREHNGKWLAIDVLSEDAHMVHNLSQAVDYANQHAHCGFFFIVRIEDSD